MKTQTILLVSLFLIAATSPAAANCTPPATNAVAAAKTQVPLPPYLTEDFNSACEKAKKEGKLVFVSLGREICGRCQKFYGFVKNGQLPIFDINIILLYFFLLTSSKASSLVSQGYILNLAF